MSVEPRTRRPKTKAARRNFDPIGQPPRERLSVVAWRIVSRTFLRFQSGAPWHYHPAAGRFPLPTTEEWGVGKGEGIPISRANPMEGAPLPSPLPARASQGEGAGGGDDGGILMRPSNPLRYFRFAATGRVIILAVMAYRTFISWGSILAAFQAVAAEQTSTAVVDKGTKSLEWWKEKISH